jgi:uncharacterized protein
MEAARAPSHGHFRKVSASFRPVAERIALLDVLRGVALLGILMFNIDSLSGHNFVRAPSGAPLPLAQFDGISGFLVVALIEAKFYSLFSMLFGIGFAVILRRCYERGVAPTPYLRRRYLWLLAIGLVHALLIWYGDILVLYALLGLLLIAFRNLETSTVLRCAIGFLVAPIVLYGIALGLSSPPGPGSGDFPPALAHAVAAFRAGDYSQVVAGNTAFTIANAFRRLILMFYPRVFGMFLLGFALGRLGVFERPQEHAGLLRRFAVFGLILGLPASIAFAALDPHRGFLPLTSLGWLRTVLESIGTPALTLGYAAWVTMAYRSLPLHAIVGGFGPVGQMALSNYLLQSLCGIAVFYGIAGGLYMKLSLTATELVAFVLFTLQVLASRAWMRRFAFGPVEWLWRQLTYAARMPIKRIAPIQKSRPA